MKVKAMTIKILLISSLILIGCSDTGDDDTSNSDQNRIINVDPNTNTGDSTTTSTGNNKVEGSIRDYSTAQGIAGVTVSSGSSQVTTDATGNYSLSGLASGDRVLVSIQKEGYARTSKIVSLSGDAITANLNVDLLPVGASQDFDPSSNAVIEVTNSSARVEIPANGLVLANGNLPSGNIHADITPVNPALDIDLMPGDMTTRDSRNQLVPIESYGAIIADFTDGSGNKLNLAAGSRATIRIPVASRGGNTPTTIPLYYFDENQGIWVEEGTATLNGDYYEGTVSHFSTWNADYLFENITIHGCVSDTEDNRKSNVEVDLEGINYNGSTSTWTNGVGEFSISAKKDAVSLLVASTATQVSNSIKVGENGETSSDVTLSECLKFGAITSSSEGLTVRLTWGENPRDLDTHVIGPNGYHIYYVNLGSLGTSPYARLDVDDTDSYGPEVFTARSFPQAGTYHYAVHHYAGSSTISQSPARVELTLNGQVTTFVPPSVSVSSVVTSPMSDSQVNQTWWNVFDIVVSDTGSIRIVPVNTWSSSEPVVDENGIQKMLVLPPKK